MIIGIVGKPSSGKSSFFKAATLIDVKISPVPFTTIKPNIGISFVMIDCVDREFGKQCRPNHGMCKNGKRYVPIKLVDVAGLVPGAHEGKGLGNQFLDDLRQASALIHIVDASGLTDEEGKVTEGHDPAADVEFLEREIDLWFASVIQKAMQKIGKPGIKIGQAEMIQILAEQLSGLEVSKAQIDKALQTSSLDDVEKFSTTLRKISKPIIIAANKIDLPEAQQNLEKLKEKFPHAFVIPTSAESEIALKKAAEKNLVEYLPGSNFTILDPYKLSNAQLAILDKIQKVVGKYGSTGVQLCLNKAVFELLDHIAVYPVADHNKLTDKDGNVLPDVYLVPKGTTAKELAFRVHTSIGEKFIAGVDARTKKRMAAEHELKNGDVVEIMHTK
ncbi:MAG TPA: redox-regulated ATPase YchF [archaeon]|nr:redox-regulated ATPase YchF [archaeon]